MILIFGGTTEGRNAARLCDSAQQPFYYSTKSGSQLIVAAHISMIYGDMCCADIVEFCENHYVKLIVDASHPFATNLHDNISKAARQFCISAIRYDRLSQNVDDEFVDYSDSIDNAIELIRERGYTKLLSLTGVNSSKKLLPILDSVDVRLRIMDRRDSWEVINICGFPIDKLVIYDDNSNDEVLFREISPEVILLKESGDSGSYSKKVALANKLNIDVLVVRRPQLPYYDKIVYGEYGLRRAIDEFMPEYFGLRTGFTTGSCATAASVASLLCSLGIEEDVNEVAFVLPNGEPYSVEVASVERTERGMKATVIKDAGDDPDVTNKLEICSEIILNHGTQSIEIKGGEGVGIVTLPGLGIEVGDSAINEVPRKMITENIRNILRRYDCRCGAEVIITVPQGRETAKRTFNSRLGIIDGISILGTSGIVQPFSSEAFLESIKRQINVVRALGYTSVVINSGAKSERYLKGYYTDIAKECFVQYGNLIGDTLKICEELEVDEVVLGVMLGKAVKLANGDLDTHSKRSFMNREFLVNLLMQSGYGDTIIQRAKDIVVARELWDIIPQNENVFFEKLKDCCYEYCKAVYSRGRIKIVLIKESGELV